MSPAEIASRQSGLQRAPFGADEPSMRTMFSNLNLSEVAESTQRVLVRTAAVASWACAAILFGAAVVTSDTTFFAQTVGPVAAAVLFSIQVLTKRENAAFTLVSAALVVTFSFSIMGTTETSLGALIALWTITVVTAFFVVKRPAAFIALGALLLATAPLTWTRILDGAVTASLTMTASFLIASILIFSVRSTSADSEYRFRNLFNSAPVALMEQDWGDALAYVRSFGVTNVPELIEAVRDDDVLANVVSRVLIRRANAKAAMLTGMPVSELLGTLPSDRVHGGSGDAFRAQLVAIWQGRPGFKTEYQTHSFQTDKPIWVRVEMVSTEVRPHSERIMLSITDITSLKESQDSLEALVKAKDDFIASISHELRTPLAGVVGLTAALLDGSVDDPDERVELLEIIGKQSQEVSYLVEDLLVGARADLGTIAIRPELIDLMGEVSEVVDGLEDPPLLDHRASAKAYADPVRVRQIIRNLVVNAHRYGGEMRRAIVSEDNGGAIFEMFDTGEPIPEELRTRIFEPYGRAHDASGTTESVGLGLAVSRQLAELMGGSLDYRYDQGSVFRLVLPTAAHAMTAGGSDVGLRSP